MYIRYIAEPSSDKIWKFKTYFTMKNSQSMVHMCSNEESVDHILRYLRS